jgi:hypothetical protein
MSMFSWLGYNKQETPEETPRQKTYVDIIISLTDSYEIDLSIFLDDNTHKLPINEKDYSAICSKFINSTISANMKKDVIDILNNQIKNPDNQQLINNIVSLVITSATTSSYKQNNFIKPSEVFSKYNT